MNNKNAVYISTELEKYAQSTTMGPEDYSVSNISVEPVDRELFYEFGLKNKMSYRDCRENYPGEFRVFVEFKNRQNHIIRWGAEFFISHNELNISIPE